MFFFFKQKTAYEMRISDWSSDVCSSDLQVHAKHPDMVLLHGGSPKGAELIAAKWADNRKVPQIAFKPDWTKHAKAAPFKRNDAKIGRASCRERVCKYV